MNSAIGFSQGWRYGLALTVATGALRMDAHRHTPIQVLAGAGIGIGADLASRSLLAVRTLESEPMMRAAVRIERTQRGPRFLDRSPGLIHPRLRISLESNRRRQTHWRTSERRR